MIDISGISYLLPIFSFVLIFAVVFAILKKTEILGDNNFIMAVISLVLAVIFISFSDARSYIEAVSPWLVVLIIAMFFVLVLGGFMLAKNVSAIARPATAWVFIAILALAFIIIGYSHFNLNSNMTFLSIKDLLSNESYSSTIVLAVVAIVIGIFITRK